jgi:hypothetical protein
LGTDQPVLLRTSERSKYRRCRQAWHWSYGLGLEAKGRKGALTFGSMVHVALAGHYVPGRKRGANPADTFAALYDANTDDFTQWDEEGNKVPARDLGIAMLEGYLALYGDDSDIEIIAPEMTFQIDVYDKAGRYLCTYVGSIDGVGKRLSTGRIVLLEHKTAKTIEQVRVNSGYGEQGLSYWWAATRMLRHLGLLGPDETVDEVMYNFLRKGMPDTRPVNAAGHSLNKPKKDDLVAACEGEGLVAKGTIPALTSMLLEVGWTEHDVAMLGEPAARQPSPLYDRQTLPYGVAQLDRFEARLRKEAWEMRQVRAGKVPVYKSPTKDCSWDCDFRDACEVHEMGGDWQSMLEFDFKPWDPYSDHAIALERT